MIDELSAQCIYILHRINAAIEASNNGQDVLDALSALDAADEAATTQLFGSRESYLRSIDEMIADPHLLFTCTQYGASIEYIAQEISDFIDRVRQHFKTSNPFIKERETLARYRYYTDEEFAAHYASLDRALVSTYSAAQLDMEFYRDEFSRAALGTTTYSLTRYELTRDWERQLTLKEIDFELHLLTEIRTKFDGSFRERMSDFRSVAANSTFDSAQMSIFWSLGRGEWIAGAFDVMSKYALLMQQNSSIQTLLADLGREGFVDDLNWEYAKKEIRDQQFRHASKSDIYGITQSDDLCSMLPIEIAILGDKSTEDDFFRRFTEKRLQTVLYESHISKYADSIERQLKAKQEKNGPFIVCIDTSGSMNGVAEELAKTICYGLIVKSQEQKRNCFLITFSTCVEVLDISDFGKNSKSIIDFLKHSFYGGTDLGPAIKRAIKMLMDERYVKADVLFISDFIAADFDAPTIRLIDDAKRSKTRFHALRIGGYCEQSLVSHFNVVWDYNSKVGEIELYRDSSLN